MHYAPVQNFIYVHAKSCFGEGYEYKYLSPFIHVGELAAQFPKVGMKQIIMLRADLGERCDGASQDLHGVTVDIRSACAFCEMKSATTKHMAKQIYMFLSHTKPTLVWLSPSSASIIAIRSGFN